MAPLIFIIVLSVLDVMRINIIIIGSLFTFQGQGQGN